MAPIFTVILDHRGEKREKDNNTDNRKEIFINIRNNVSQEITEEEHTDSPEKPTENIVGKKTGVVHLGYTGNDRCESADDGNETGNNNGFTAVFFIEAMSVIKMFLVEKNRIIFSKDLGANFFTKPITN